MTATMKIVRLFDTENPKLVEMFTEEYRQKIKEIDSKIVDMIKTQVEFYIKENLADCLISYKLYAYKLIKSVVVEILLKPIETASIMEYHLHVSHDESKLVRIR